MKFPWQDQPLEQTLTALTAALVNLWEHKPAGSLLPAIPGGRGDEEIDARERAIGRPIPQDIRQLYRAVDGIEWHGEPILTGGTFLIMLDGAGWLDPDDHSELIDLPTQWKRTDYFHFAQSVAGDCIVCCERPPRGKPGSVILIDHECANRAMADWRPRWYTPIVYLADSLSDWLARWVCLGFDDLAVSSRQDHTPELERVYLLDHLRLNPGLEWAEKRLKELDIGN